MIRTKRLLRSERLEERCLLAAAILRQGDIAYLVSEDAAIVSRYDIPNETWLSSLSLGSDLNPTAALVDGDGIYVAYGKAVYRYDLEGSNGRHLINTLSPVKAIHSDGNLLFINYTSGLYTRAVSINKTTETLIDTVDDYLDTIYGSSISPTLNRIFGRTSGTSPSDISFLEYDDDGFFGINSGSPYHGDYPSANKTWVFPDESKVIDSSGIVYATQSLDYLNSLGTSIDDIAFYQDEIPIVLNGATLTSYSNSLLLAGSTTLDRSPERIFVNDENVLAFSEDATALNGFSVSLIDLDTISPPVPSDSIDPVGLPYTPTNIEIAVDGSLLIYSKSQASVFRWDIRTQAYTESIPLIGSADYMAYSAANDTLYLAYSNGLIRQIDLSGPSRDEVPFATLPGRPLGLEAAGEYLFAVDPSGAWVSHYTFRPDGTLISAVDWNRSSSEFIWNAENRKMYFFRDGTSPNDLHTEDISVGGEIVGKAETPLHGGPFRHPIRVAPSGDYVVLGSGAMFDGRTLAQLSTSLPFVIDDAAWIGTQLFTMRNIGGVSQVQAWDGPTFAPGKIRQSEATGVSIVGVGGMLVSIGRPSDGIPKFEILNADLEPTDKRTSPDVIWTSPATLVSGQPLTGVELDAEASVYGSFEYTPAIGTVLPVGINQTLSVTFTPTDTDTYATVTRTVSIDVLGMDFGDAPNAETSGFAASYPVELADDGARHLMSDLYLGENISVEADGRPSNEARADEDDDGVVVVASVFALPEDTSQSSLQVIASQSGKVDAWIDFNQDGDWDDPGEHVVKSRDVDGGATLLDFDVPAAASLGATGMRVRISSDGGLTPLGFAVDGEVEDYWVEISAPADGFQVDTTVLGGPLNIQSSDGKVTVSNQGILIASFPSWVFGVVDVSGDGGDSVVQVGEGEGELVIRGDAGGGEDSIVLMGANQMIDLRSIVSGQLTGIEMIDVRGLGINEIFVSPEAIDTITDSRNSLALLADEDDLVHLGDGWSVGDLEKLGEDVVHVLRQGTATLRLKNDRAFTNPVIPFDTNRSGDTTALDALLIINWLQRNGVETALTFDNAGGRYLDASGDGGVSSLDALRIINQLAKKLLPEGEGIAAKTESALNVDSSDQPQQNSPSDFSTNRESADFDNQAILVDEFFRLSFADVDRDDSEDAIELRDSISLLF